MTNFLPKLSERMRLALAGDLDSQLHRELCDKYQLSDAQRADVAGIVGDVLYQRLPITQIEQQLGTVGIPKKVITGLACDIVGMRLLAFDQEFTGQPVKFLTDHKVADGLYRAYVDRHEQTITQEQRQIELDNTIEEATPIVDPITSVESNPVEEKRSAIEIFSRRILDLIRVEHEGVREILHEYNTILITLLTEDKDFVSQLTQAFVNNNEELFTTQINLGGKMVPATIANLLKDFVSQSGANYFDNLILSQYLTNNPNCRQLSANDKAMVRTVLEIYRNIRFFPSAFNQIPPNQWQIIPITEHLESDPVAVSTPTSSSSQADPSALPDLATELRQYDWKSLTGIERRALLEQYSITEDDLSRLGIT